MPMVCVCWDCGRVVNKTRHMFSGVAVKNAFQDKSAIFRPVGTLASWAQVFGDFSFKWSYLSIKVLAQIKSPKVEDSRRQVLHRFVIASTAICTGSVCRTGFDTCKASNTRNALQTLCLSHSWWCPCLGWTNLLNQVSLSRFFPNISSPRQFKASTKCNRMSSVFPTRSECMYSSRPVPVLLCFAPGKIIYGWFRSWWSHDFVGHPED